jgi:hypothetical protein
MAIHHSDDTWEAEKLKKQVKYLEDNSKIGAVLTNVLAVDENGEILTDRTHFYWGVFDQANRSSHEWLRQFFEHVNVLCHPSVLILKSCY